MLHFWTDLIVPDQCDYHQHNTNIITWLVLSPHIPSDFSCGYVWDDVRYLTPFCYNSYQLLRIFSSKAIVHHWRHSCDLCHTTSASFPTLTTSLAIFNFYIGIIHSSVSNYSPSTIIASVILSPFTIIPTHQLPAFNHHQHTLRTTICSDKARIST